MVGGVHGRALGVGFALAALCDITIAADERLAAVPPGGSLWVFALAPQ